MRIVGDIPHPSMKITIFQHDSKYSIKFENGLYEMTYKFRSGDDLDSVESIKVLVDQEFIAQVLATLPKMHQQKLGAISRFAQGIAVDEFEEII